MKEHLNICSHTIKTAVLVDILLDPPKWIKNLRRKDVTIANHISLVQVFTRWA